MTTWAPLLDGSEGSVYVDHKQQIVLKRAQKWPFVCFYWKKLVHKNFQELLRVKETNIDNCIYTRYMVGQDLLEALQDKKYVKLAVKLDVMRQLVSGIQYLHQKNIIHGDIKPENIVVSDDFKDVKFIDLNRAIGMKNCFYEDLQSELRRKSISKEGKESSSLKIDVRESSSLKIDARESSSLKIDANENRSRSEEIGHLYLCGTKRYTAPEAIPMGKSDQKMRISKYTRNGAMIFYKAMDVFSLGLTFLMLLENDVYTYEKNCNLHWNIRRIIDLMMNKNPNERLSINQCVNLFQSSNLHLSSFSFE